MYIAYKGREKQFQKPRLIGTPRVDKSIVFSVISSWE
jgi:hypothetical protein